ncbi:MAG: hypothetical protein ACHQ6T_08065 [Myxococcota bacterium]
MSSPADERSRILGGLVCLSAIAAGALFIGGVLAQNWWALAIPVAAAVLFVLGLVTWIGWTIATVQVEAEGEKLTGTGGAGGAARSEDAPKENPRGVR